MASGISKANARQNKANEAAYNRYRANGQRERNKLLRLARHMKKMSKTTSNFTDLNPKGHVKKAWHKAAVQVPNAFSNDLIKNNKASFGFFGI